MQNIANVYILYFFFPMNSKKENEPPFSSPVLKPRLYLRVRDFQRFGETCPLG